MATAGHADAADSLENESGNLRSLPVKSSGTPLDRTIDRIGMGESPTDARLGLYT
jgi:hypothetical protein